MNEPVTQLSIETLFNGDDRYLIPMYQRNYAWEEGEIGQLIQDVIDAMPAGKSYYLGSLVVYPRPGHGPAQFETLDGQQRLTTLSLLVLYLQKQLALSESFSRSPVAFENRPQSSRTLEAIACAEGHDDLGEKAADKHFNSAILNGYRLVHKLVPARLRESNATLKGFADYLLQQVQIMRVQVPEGTQLNHYFEVMNNRGEQLEKHEVLKARLLEVLGADAETAACVHQVWEACANMEKYVQTGFSPEQRTRLFDESRLRVDGFTELMAALKDARPADVVDASTALTLDAILADPATAAQHYPVDKDEGAPERFGSVINFPNFLLHVLRLHAEQRNPGSAETIALDDKRLLQAFDTHLLKAANREQAGQFMVDLLRCKALYDQFVVKRVQLDTTDGWSLKRCKSDSPGISYPNTFGGEQDKHLNLPVLMLLSAFHVSAPSQAYKYWLYAALRYLFQQADQPVEAAAYLDYLLSIAKGFVFDRALAQEGMGYHEIIHREGRQCLSGPESIDLPATATRLRYGAIENNLVFNFLDYLLWQKHRATDADVEAFRFTFRSSVEHHYPRNPVSATRLEEGPLNAFGNLYLISHSKNSRLSNHLPEHKKQHYKAAEMDSVKQHLMMRGNWGAGAIARHEGEMLQVLRDSLART
ncbi:GmrSD restriction endonuclease domain-containing protein [Pseudomonas huaxiensis]|uniref:GmrSD restriction endonuclease domain-containing protein n=1 Tax=Pseudomonas huaxiensis TaxID=2213017 RepID=UPI000DA6B7D1|nr:DUF262 domain-containing protein [Pseudomonas huaxiensis]